MQSFGSFIDKVHSLKHPRIPCCGRQFHRHGSYSRSRSIEGQEKVAVQRWICPKCRTTFGLIPQDMLLYRPIRMDQFDKHMDSFCKDSGRAPSPLPASSPPQATPAENGLIVDEAAALEQVAAPAAAEQVAAPTPAEQVAAPSPTSKLERSYFHRVRKTLTARLPLLCKNFGLNFRAESASCLVSFWLDWRQLGSTMSSLVYLAEKFNTSLFLCYRSLQPPQRLAAPSSRTSG